MTRSETTNTFQEGLVMDLNPLTTPNNVLTSCLNGTFITYNGNEYVLQNDFGNGRVESAYLPSGYVPVGITESGGIIYIASYNPITNKCQIGSFPSPERNISSEELSDSDAVLDLSLFSKNLIQRVKLFGENTKIRAGDKFSIIMQPNVPYELKNLISNYQNIENNEVKSYKDKLITLQVCVLDQNNNLSDITSTLKRFDQVTNKEIKDGYLLDAQTYFNTEYFTQTFDKKPTSIEAYRQKDARNVFNSKLVGSLCIVATLNTVQYFDVALDAEKVSQNQYLFYIETAYRYNCPDNKYNNTQTYGFSEDYNPNSSILGYKISLNPGTSYQFDFKTGGPFDTKILEEGYDNCTNYDEQNNLFESIQLDTLNYNGSGIVYYEAVPISIVGELSGLTRYGQINLDKINTGVIQLTTWKYYKNSSYVNLLWGLESYPKRNEKLSDFTMEFYDIYNPSQPAFIYYIEDKRSYNGVFNELLHLPDWEGDKNKLFLVKISYTSSLRGKQILAYRWLFNTTLYNEAFYKIQSQDFGSEEGELELYPYRELVINNLSTFDYDRTPITQTDPIRIEQENEEEGITYYTDTNVDYTFYYNDNKQLEREELYPFTPQIEVVDDLQVDPDKSKELSSAQVVTSGPLDDQYVVNQRNFRDFINLNLTNWIEDQKISVGMRSLLYYEPEDILVTFNTVFTAIMDSFQNYFGASSVQECATFYVWGQGITGRGQDKHGVKVWFMNTQSMTHDNLVNNFNTWPSITYDEYNGVKVYNSNVNLDYAMVENIIKEKSQPVVLVSSFPGAGINEIGDEQILETRISISTDPVGFEPVGGHYRFQALYWKDENGTPVLLNIFIDKTNPNKDLHTSVYNILNTVYKKVSTQYGPVLVEGIKDKYVYDCDYILNLVIYVNDVMTINKIVPDSYISAVQNIVTSLQADSSLIPMAQFHYDNIQNSILTVDFPMQVFGMDSLYQDLSSPIRDAGIKLPDGTFITPEPDITLDPNGAYYYNNGNITVAPIEYALTFKERDGLFYINSQRIITASNHRCIYKYEGDNSNNRTRWDLDGIPVADVKFLNIKNTYEF